MYIMGFPVESWIILGLVCIMIFDVILSILDDRK
jgi:hypothetical protein